eukprot:s502_g18.t1
MQWFDESVPYFPGFLHFHLPIWSLLPSLRRCVPPLNGSPAQRQTASRTRPVSSYRVEGPGRSGHRSFFQPLRCLGTPPRALQRQRRFAALVHSIAVRGPRRSERA